MVVFLHFLSFVLVIADMESLQALSKMNVRLAKLRDDLFGRVPLAWHKMPSFVPSKTLILWRRLDSVKGARSVRKVGLELAGQARGEKYERV